MKILNELDSSEQEDIKPPESINEADLKFLYSNSDLGNSKRIPIASGNESSILDYWIQDLPLKVTTHGWLSSEKNNSGVFAINAAYVDVGGFNVISVDWSCIADDPKYPVPAVLTKAVGSAIANFLDHLVDVTGIDSSDIHLIGHSLGAHVVGSCGYHFKSGKIGRITGLDPAAPGYETISVHLPHLNKEDAEFVDIIHTSGGTIGFFKSIGHVDFFPNSGTAPQPGCYSLFKLLDFMHCSHSRSYELYADSVYHKNSLVAVNCSSWEDYKCNKCENNTRAFMGHDALPSVRGNFFLNTKKTSPFSTNTE
ncbi:pancreatic triacylglycerol lipase-like [Rhopalosiphum padi]|uniref:pancreatic triacylglycerol lipase-like n=1 Tax=Rhopalosiphum padi TaxID=40932 RepID=UPI00298EB741|nr:pancreatic triacylglycerol lipase-like [Rhopalosiphum padi]